MLAKNFKHIRSNDNSIIFAYKTKSSSRSNFNIDMLKWDIETNDQGPEYVSYELRYKKNRDIEKVTIFIFQQRQRSRLHLSS